MMPPTLIAANGMLIRVPKYVAPETVFEWKIPEVWNAFERNRGRAYAVAYEAMVAYDNWLKGMDLLKRGEDRTATSFAVPQDHRMGVGFCSAGRGWLTHLMACPRDPWG